MSGFSLAEQRKRKVNREEVPEMVLPGRMGDPWCGVWYEDDEVEATRLRYYGKFPIVAPGG